VEASSQEAGLDGLRVHDLRHTYVSLMIAAGVNPKEVSTWAGHSTVAFTLDRYGHLYEEHADEAMGRLDAMLSQARPSGEIRALR
jgi:integrase